MLKHLLAAAALSGTLTACGESTPPNQITANTNTLATYKVDVGALTKNTITEYRLVSNPDYVCLSIQATKSNATDCWKQDARILVGKFKILAKYENPSGDVIEFSPASNPEKICIINNWGGVSLKCQ